MSRGSLHTSAFNQRRLGSLDTPTSSHGNSGSSSARLGHELSPSFSSENRVRSLRQARKSLVETSPAHDTPRSRKQNEEADDFIECVSDRLTQAIGGDDDDDDDDAIEDNEALREDIKINPITRCAITLLRRFVHCLLYGPCGHSHALHMVAGDAHEEDAVIQTIYVYSRHVRNACSNRPAILAAVFAFFVVGEVGRLIIRDFRAYLFSPSADIKGALNALYLVPCGIIGVVVAYTKCQRQPLPHLRFVDPASSSAKSAGARSSHHVQASLVMHSWLLGGEGYRIDQLRKSLLHRSVRYYASRPPLKKLLLSDAMWYTCELKWQTFGRKMVCLDLLIYLAFAIAFQFVLSYVVFERDIQQQSYVAKYELWRDTNMTACELGSRAANCLLATVSNSRRRLKGGGGGGGGGGGSDGTEAVTAAAKILLNVGDEGSCGAFNTAMGYSTKSVLNVMPWDELRYQQSFPGQKREQMFDDNNNYLELTLGMLGLLVTFFVYYFIYEIAKMRFSLRMYFSRFGNYLTMLHLFLVGLAICFILFRWQSQEWPVGPATVYSLLMTVTYLRIPVMFARSEKKFSSMLATVHAIFIKSQSIVILLILVLFAMTQGISVLVKSAPEWTPSESHGAYSTLCKRMESGLPTDKSIPEEFKLAAHLWESSFSMSNLLSTFLFLFDPSFDNVNASETSSPWLAKLLYTSFTIIGLLIMLNELIAVMSGAYDEMMERIDEVQRIERASLIVDIEQQLSASPFFYFCRKMLDQDVKHDKHFFVFLASLFGCQKCARRFIRKKARENEDDGSDGDGLIHDERRGLDCDCSCSDWTIANVYPKYIHVLHEARRSDFFDATMADHQDEDGRTDNNKEEEVGVTADGSAALFVTSNEAKLREAPRKYAARRPSQIDGVDIPSPSLLTVDCTTVAAAKASAAAAAADTFFNGGSSADLVVRVANAAVVAARSAVASAMWDAESVQHVHVSAVAMHAMHTMHSMNESNPMEEHARAASDLHQQSLAAQHESAATAEAAVENTATMFVEIATQIGAIAGAQSEHQRNIAEDVKSKKVLTAQVRGLQKEVSSLNEKLGSLMDMMLRTQQHRQPQRFPGDDHLHSSASRFEIEQAHTASVSSVQTGVGGSSGEGMLTHGVHSSAASSSSSSSEGSGDDGSGNANAILNAETPQIQRDIRARREREAMERRRIKRNRERDRERVLQQTSSHGTSSTSTSTSNSTSYSDGGGSGDGVGGGGGGGGGGGSSSVQSKVSTSFEDRAVARRRKARQMKEASDGAAAAPPAPAKAPTYEERAIARRRARRAT